MKFSQFVSEVTVLKHETLAGDMQLTINGEPVDNYSVKISGDTINLIIVPVVKETAKKPPLPPKGLSGTAKADLPQQ
jgi:hypothetical protein